MSRFLHISFIAAAVLSLASCNDRIVPVEEETGTGEKVTIIFTPHFLCSEDNDLPDTKAMGNRPGNGAGIKNIYFAVFDQAGYKLSEYAKAIPMQLAEDNNVSCQYSVELTATKQKRIIHIIANAPESLRYGSEAEVIGSLISRYDADETYEWQDAYWDRIEIDNVIAKSENESAYNAMMDKLSHATLVRNFARIIVQDNVDNSTFQLTRYWLTNFPDRGSMAPYNRNTRGFALGYKTYETIEEASDPAQGNYQGYSPADTELLTLDGLIAGGKDINALAIDSGQNFTSFCYERETPHDHPLYLIIAGYYNGSTNESFYKLDLLNHQDEYFPLLRNFTYKVVINSVEHAGASTWQGALSSDPSGNVDASLDMKDLSNISDGTAQIFVTETSAVIVNENAVTLRYKFIPDIKSTEGGVAKRWNGVGESNKRTDPGDNGHGPYVTIEREWDGLLGKVFEDSYEVAGNGVGEWANDDQGDHYRVITLHPKHMVDDIIRTETFTITGHYWSETKNDYVTISRDVVYQRRNHFNIDLSLDPGKVKNALGQGFDLIIGLEDGLPSSIFSLDFEIEAAGLSISTSGVNSLPIEVKGSGIPGNIINGNGSPKPAYSFMKTVTWSDYRSAPVVDGQKRITCHFETNTANIPSLSNLTAVASATSYPLPNTGNGDLIQISNKYFNNAYVHYVTYDEKRFGDVGLKKNSSKFDGNPVVDTEYDLSFDMAAGFTGSAKVTVGLKGFTPSDLAAYPVKGTDGEEYELYEMTVNKVSGNTISIVPYQAGSGSIKIMSDEYITETINKTIVN